jgi:hypothetical protein
MGGSQADAVVDVNPVAAVLSIRLHCGVKLVVREKEASASGSRRVPFPAIQDQEAAAASMGSRRRRLLPRSNLKIGGGKREKRTEAAAADHDVILRKRGRYSHE